MKPKQKKVVLVEDEPALHHSLSVTLKKYGIDVLGAFDGEEGLRMIKTSLPDAVVLDLVLPRKHGLEVLEAMREDPATKHVPVMVLTNAEDLKMVQRAMELGIAAYLLKVDHGLDDIAERVLRLFNGSNV